ncbi:CKLF-like MARVEL transmembrane domain-containing protein 8b [Nelusetta ayraudi]|uniref:CKLF-like MARVEL transmembrane domain-containing protein 8b n=1 Tax=Nelusetta ayraudi TaxID=303726 RepID=UPI003F7303BB
MEQNAMMPTYRSPQGPDCSTPTSTLAFDHNFTTTARGSLLLIEIVSGMMVWILVGGTEYFLVSALCWLMFFSVLCWALTICLFIAYLTGVHSRLSQVSWTELSLCFNCGATALYLVTAVVNALSLNRATRGRHNYNCWAASTFFAFLCTLCYAVSSHLSYRAWRSTEERQ